MYEPVKTFYMGSNPGEAPFLTKVKLLHHACEAQHMANVARSDI